MLTKELENILKAFPNFLSMLADTGNPLKENAASRETLETVTKAMWFIIPFHFMAFLGMVPLKGNDSTLVLLVGFVSLLGLSWIGTFMGSMLSRLLKWGPIRREGCIAGWVSTLFITWFFCVMIIFAANLYFYIVAQPEAAWPDLFNQIENLVEPYPFVSQRSWLLIYFCVPAVSAIAMLMIIPTERRGSAWQQGVLVFMCAGSCALFIYSAKVLLAPVVRM